jgi:DEAD/DEAH box helicase domain-containing protein
VAPSPAGVAPSAIAEFVAALEADAELGRALVHREPLPALAARCAPTPAAYAQLAPVLARRGICALYTHQGRALAALERGRDVVLATSTASGKTLVYALSTLRAALADPCSRALYLFPLKALSQDQRRGLESDIDALGRVDLRVAVYDGDTPAARRRALREDPPQVLITTPDMLHAGLLPHHGLWREFFSHLGLVVVDELHTYRGVFGAHVAQVMRRLERVARHHGATPRVVAASATLANAGELAHALFGRAFEVIEEDGAPRAARDVLLFRPRGSPYTLAAQLFRSALARGLRTIAFTKARVITELLHNWILEAEPELAPRISSYRAGFLPSERREIERRLFDGQLSGVIATSALELGIDVGGLDVCILVGYPGSQIATWQRSGRVGRRGEAVIALVAQPDALDQYLVGHPEVFFARGPERAVLDPHCAEITRAHLPCAAAELPLREGEPWLAAPETRAQIEALEEQAALLRSDTDPEWYAARRQPHRAVSLREAGSSYAIVLDGRGEEAAELVGSIGAANVFSECHAGAIYLHRGRQFHVAELDTEKRCVRVRGVRVPYYTRSLATKETEILARLREREAGCLRIVLGRVRVTTQVTGYERRRVHGQDLLATEPLDLPPTAFESCGVWLELPLEVPAALEASQRHPMGGIHALEHAALSLFPLFALCDRHDVAGITYLRHPQLGRPAIFFYDAHAGGVGITASLFDRVESLLEATCELIADCACESGCPGCVHSPKCSNGNRPIDKPGALQALSLLLGREPLPALPLCSEESEAAPASFAQRAEGERRPAGRVSAPADRLPRLVYFDLETQKSAEDVGGWQNAHRMRVAVAVIHDSAIGRCEVFDETRVSELRARLAAADLVIGYNVRRFDYAVLRGYPGADPAALPTFDLLEDLQRRIGFRLPMGHLAQETLGMPKSGDGLQSLAWWRAGEVARVADYCRRDVEILRALFEHTQAHGHLRFRTRDGHLVRLPARWQTAELIESARAQLGRAVGARPRRRRASSSKSIRAVTGSAPAIVTATRSPSS